MSSGSSLTAITLAFLTAGAAVAAPAPGTRRPGPTGPGAAAPPAPRAVAPTAPLTAAERTLVNPNTVLVYPFDKAPQPNAPTGLGETIASDLRRGMDASGKYSAASYYRNSPLVTRAVGAGITQEDVTLVVDPQRGVTDQDRALKIGSAVGVASAVLGAIEEYRYDPQTRKADITTTVQFLQVPGGTPIKTVGVTGTATGAAGASEDGVARMAAHDAARRALTELGVPAARPVVVTPSARAGGKKQQARPQQRSGSMVD